MDLRNKDEHKGEFINQHMFKLETLTSVEILEDVTYREAFIRYISTDTVEGPDYEKKKYMHRLIHGYSLCENIEENIHLIKKPEFIWKLAEYARDNEEMKRFINKMKEYVKRNFKRGMRYELENLKMAIVDTLKETEEFQQFCCMDEDEHEKFENIFESIYWDIYS